MVSLKKDEKASVREKKERERETEKNRKMCPRGTI